MKKNIARFCNRTILAAAVFVLPATAFSTTLIKADVPMLRQASESVVRAQVESIKSAWNDQHNMIFTYVTLSKVQTLHGKAVDQVTVRVPGGTADGKTILMDEAPQFQKGDSVVVFLTRWDDGAMKVTGYSQGVSKVVTDKLGNQLLQGGSADGRLLSDLARQLGKGGAQ